MNEPVIGTIVLRTRGDQRRDARVDETLLAHQDHWLVREIIHFMKRTLKRLDLTARSFFALIEPGSCFAGIAVRAGARRRSLLHARRPRRRTNTIALSAMNGGPLPMSNGLTRLQTRFLGEPEHVDELLGARRARSTPAEAIEAGLVSFAPDELDWDDEVRLAIESARGVLARRADRPGSQPPLRRAGDDGDEDLRPADGVAELDLQPAERRRREGRAHGVRRAGRGRSSTSTGRKRRPSTVEH